MPSVLPTMTARPNPRPRIRRSFHREHDGDLGRWQRAEGSAVGLPVELPRLTLSPEPFALIFATRLTVSATRAPRQRPFRRCAPNGSNRALRIRRRRASSDSFSSCRQQCPLSRRRKMHDQRVSAVRVKRLGAPTSMRARITLTDRSRTVDEVMPVETGPARTLRRDGAGTGTGSVLGRRGCTTTSEPPAWRAPASTRCPSRPRSLCAAGAVVERDDDARSGIDTGHPCVRRPEHPHARVVEHDGRRPESRTRLPRMQRLAWPPPITAPCYIGYAGPCCFGLGPWSLVRSGPCPGQDQGRGTSDFGRT